MTEQEQVFELAGSMRVPATFSDPQIPDCPLVFVNNAFEELTGYSSSWAVGRNCRFLQGEATEKKDIKKLRQSVHECLPSTTILANYKANGEKFHNLLIIRPIWLKDGQCILMGCQYEFEFSTRRRAIEKNCNARLRAGDELIGRLRRLELQAKDTLAMRSEAAALRVQNYIASERLRG